MKFIIQLIAIIVIASILELFLPWWSIAIAAFIPGYVLKTKSNFLAGLLAIALLWFAKSWLLDLSASGDLTERVATLLMVKQPLVLMLVTALIGGLVAGFAAMSGASLKKEKRDPDLYL